MEKIKRLRLEFFSTALYSLLSHLCSIGFIILVVMIAIKDNMDAIYTLLVPVLLVLAIVFRIAQGIRRKKKTKKLPVKVDALPFSAKEIKNYKGIAPDDPLEASYNKMRRNFDKMSKSKLSLIIVSSEINEEKRSAVGRYITPATTKLELSTCDILPESKMKVPMLLDRRGNPLYLYPHFVLVVRGRKDVVAIPYSKLDLSFEPSSYVLEKGEKVPKDAIVDGKVYKHCNKDGSPDLRVSNNPYTLSIRTATILSKKYNIEYELSNLQAVSDFCEAYEDFVNSISTITNAKRISSITSEENHQSDVSATKGSAPIEELQSLVGLQSVKKEIQTLANLVQIQQARANEGLKNAAMSYHLVFTGNPGTGKTTIARIIASIYKDLGILKKGHLIETDRSGLVAEYLGQTAVKTNKIIDSALDGILFIDEAYSLSEDQDSYGKEAIATLLKRMEDDRNRLVVILAGYTNKMKQFISSNPGLESRFNRYIEFPDYSADELMKIFMNMMGKYDYIVNEEAKEKIQEIIQGEVEGKDEQFGNARFVRNLYEKVLANQANRLAGENGKLTGENLRTIIVEDCKV